MLYSEKVQSYTSSDDLNEMFHGECLWETSASAPLNAPEASARGRVLALDLKGDLYAHQVAFTSNKHIYGRMCTSKSNKTWTGWLLIANYS